MFKLAAYQGHAGAQANLGVFYRDGDGGLPKDDREAARLFKLATDQGNAHGQCNLGFFYDTGRGGLPKDEREAARLYKLAADQGNAWAQREYEKKLEQQRQQQRREQETRQREREQEARREQHSRTKQQPEEWWEVLGVSKSARLDDINDAHRRKIKLWHPDRLHGLAPELVRMAEEKTKELNRAFEQATRLLSKKANCC
jgi:TPR repeat protein